MPESETKLAVPAFLRPPYFWDHWHASAIETGMEPEAALAGRALIRECYEHGWIDRLGPEIWKICGWADGGAAMRVFGRGYPRAAALLWLQLVEADAMDYPRLGGACRSDRELLKWVFAQGTWPATWPMGETPRPLS